jgi:hypothetical protein
MKICFLFICLLLSAFSAQATDIYVSPNGCDINDGSIQSPFATIHKAQLVARDVPGPVTIYLRQGTFYLDKPIVFNIQDTRQDNAPLFITAFQNEAVTISGGRELKLKWRRYKKDVYQAKLAKGLDFDQLYADGKKMILARYPNFDANIRHFNGYAADAISPAKLKSWARPQGAFLHAMHKSMWGDMHFTITGADKNGQAILNGGHQNNRPTGPHVKYRMVENVFEELDDYGEWYYNPQNGILYFCPSENLDIESATLQISRLTNLFEFRGSQKNPVRNISIKNITFKHTQRTFMEKYEPLLRSDWQIYRGGALFLKGCENCSIENCTLQNLGGNGIMVSNYNRHLNFSSNKMTNIGATAIMFVGDPKAVRSPSFNYTEYVNFDNMNRLPGPKTENYPADCVVYDNLIFNIGTVEKQVAGVQISMARNITVSHNSIYNVPRAGINISEGTWGGHLIEFNDVFKTVLETGDHGSFNSWGRDRFWHPDRKVLDQLVKKHPQLIMLDPIETTIIRNNRFRCDYGWDIDLDDGSSNYYVTNNLCLNGGIKLREGFNRIVQNNIMINNSFHPHVWFENSHDVFHRNIVGTWYKPIRLLGWGDEIDFNVFPQKSMLEKSQKLNLDKNGIVGGTRFINPANGDYRITSGDSAFQTGFENFDMDKFGVVSPFLKEQALTPDFPIPIKSAAFAEKTLFLEWRGAKLKNIIGLAEQSATGLPEARGVWIIELNDTGLLAKEGIFKGDVILQFENEKIDTLGDLLLAEKSAKWKSQVGLTIFRNQQEIKIKINNH